MALALVLGLLVLAGLQRRDREQRRLQDRTLADLGHSRRLASRAAGAALSARGPAGRGRGRRRGVRRHGLARHPARPGADPPAGARGDRDRAARWSRRWRSGPPRSSSPWPVRPPTSGWAGPGPSTSCCTMSEPMERHRRGHPAGEGLPGPDRGGAGGPGGRPGPRAGQPHRRARPLRQRQEHADPAARGAGPALGRAPSPTARRCSPTSAPRGCGGGGGGTSRSCTSGRAATWSSTSPRPTTSAWSAASATPTRCSARWASPSRPGTGWTSSPAASSSGSRCWRRWRPAAPCWSPTSRPRTSTTSARARCSTGCAAPPSGDGTTVVYTTHDPRITEEADRLLHLDHGVLTTEHDVRAATRLGVIDASGRVQLPAEARALFPTSRVAIEVEDGRVVLHPPPDDQGVDR